MGSYDTLAEVEMAHGKRFDAAELGLTLTALGERQIALVKVANLCEHARLTEKQGKLVMLWTLGCTHSMIARALNIKERKNVWRELHRALDKIGRAHAPPAGRYRSKQWAAELLHAFRNYHSRGGDAPVLTYDELGRVVTTRATLITVDDLMGVE